MSREALEDMFKATLAASDDDLAPVLAAAFADAVYRVVPTSAASDCVHIRAVLEFLDQQPYDLKPIDFYVDNTKLEEQNDN